jgi:DNA/RNA-binding domain of Phe-tRNA-synthetase-like protein
MDVAISRRARDLGVRIALSVMEDIVVVRSPEVVLEALLSDLKDDLKGRYRAQEDLLADARIRGLRDFYWRIGIDPTKTRPASEALIRRILKKEIPSINTLVDAGNLASAKTCVPIGLYDLDKVVGSCEIVLSEGGEEFRPIGGEPYALDKGVPVLKDEAGVLHLYPYRDCQRTKITTDTTKALAISCGCRGIPDRDLEDALERLDGYFFDLSAG